MSNPTVSIEELAKQATEWRHSLHQMPELLFDLPRTAAFISSRLEALSCDELHTGIATSGIVAVFKGSRGPGKTIALRCDMDALPIAEKTNLPHASKTPNMMHACGHDGHSAIMLALAHYLSDHRDFAGKVVLVFQPAEEGGAGGKVMLSEGLLERFGIEEVYGMHNLPGIAVGDFATCTGGMMAAGDRFVVTISGQGGHAAYPYKCDETMLASAQLVSALQSIAARYVDPLDNVVVSITYIEGGNRNALNVLPGEVHIGGSIRTLKPETRKVVEARFRQIVQQSASLYNCEAEIEWMPGYPVVYTDPEKTMHVVAAAKAVAGADHVDANYPPIMGSEDFAYMLEQRPGGFVWLGNGDGPNLHDATYDFNDAAILPALKYWSSLVSTILGDGAEQSAQ
ncbi:amidohydrolase [uncultured Cohaesibacter sp.]|uniref:amidohydrolase n=1 Tax=uncultured Cohaesibacter sp. TaxID=1002546 RepID=UPI0029C6BB3B|nr:amidohydrolase [uncultured Cohaesibacter sp.]